MSEFNIGYDNRRKEILVFYLPEHGETISKYNLQDPGIVYKLYFFFKLMARRIHPHKFNSYIIFNTFQIYSAYVSLTRKKLKGVSFFFSVKYSQQIWIEHFNYFSIFTNKYCRKFYKYLCILKFTETTDIFTILFNNH